jgi:DNA-binding MarR family transcriptional regulator
VDDTRWLTEAEARAWRGYRRMRGLLDLQTSRDLAHDSGLSEPDYDVLSTLSEVDGRRIRLNELADHMLWSRSRLSHHITRMQQRGLVARQDCASDGRGAEIVLTEQGLQAIQDAAPDHVESVRRNFVDLLTSDQLDTLSTIADTVLAHLTTLNSARPDARGPR